MSIPQNYFFIDGSCLLGDIVKYNKETQSEKKLNAEKFLRYFTSPKFSNLHYGSYKRFTFYFADGENRIENYIIMPKKADPHALDIEIKSCGKKIPKSQKIEDRIQGNDIPQFILDTLRKSEKGVDTQICCDALLLAERNKLERLFLYTDDSDFIPLCNTLKNLGCNVSLFRLSEKKFNINKDLADSMDSFSVMPEDMMDGIFKE